MADEQILNKISAGDYTEESKHYSAQEFAELVQARRSCRVYTDEPVPESIIDKCLDLALLAPNSSNLQPWKFYWVKSPEKRTKLNKYCLDQPAATTAPEIIVAIACPENWKESRILMLQKFKEQDKLKVPKAAYAYYDKLVPLVYSQGPLGIFGLMKRVYVWVQGLFKPMPRKPLSISHMKTWAHKSTALACENLMLAFRAYGYDTCPMEGLDEKRVKRLLELKSSEEVCMAISIGKRASNGIYGPRIRFDRNLFVKEI